MSYNIRKGKKKDVTAVYQLVKELAEFEKAPGEVSNTAEKMLQDAFGPEQVIDFLVAEVENEIVGTAIFFTSYSTWKGKCLYLEDLIVTKAHRGRGIGKSLFEAIAREAAISGAQRMAWQVLDWNQPAIDFYQQMGAELAPEWVNCRLNAQQLQAYR